MSALTRAIRALAAINTEIGTVSKWLSLSLIAVMLAIMVVAVFFRYVLNSSLTWSEDVVLMMAIWMTFSLAPMAHRIGANVSLDTLVAPLKGRAHHILRILVNLLIILLLGFLVLETIGFVERGFNIRANTVSVQMGWIYMILPVSFVAMILASIELILRDWVGILAPGDELATPPPMPDELHPSDG